MSTKEQPSSSGWRAGRSAARYGDTERVHRGSPLIVYDFAQVDKLLQGLAGSCGYATTHP
jgi:hypothetical protein